MVSMLHKLIGDGNEKALKKLYPLRDKINAREAEVRKLTDLQLQEKTEEFKGRLGSKGTLDDLLPEAFAVVREMAMRRPGQRQGVVQGTGDVVDVLEQVLVQRPIGRRRGQRSYLLFIPARSIRV